MQVNYLTRREFLKLCAGTATALGVAGAGWPGLAAAVGTVAGGNPPVLWIKGSGCNGCSVSMMNTAAPGLREMLADLVQMAWHPGFISGGGANLVAELLQLADNNKDKFILVVEGAIPKGADGRFHIMGKTADGRTVTFVELVRRLGQQARLVLAVGSCAAFGGLHTTGSNPMGFVGVEKVTAAEKVVNIPGCPAHPDWMVATLLHAVLYGKPEVDDFGRPQVFYGSLIHNICPRRQYFDNSIFAENFGEEGCLLEIGCKGPLTHGDCPIRLWNRGRNWCVGGEGPCIGCTEPSFPRLMMPFFARMPEISGPGIQSTADTIGITLGVATGVGLAAHLAGNILTGRVGPGRNKAEDKAVDKAVDKSVNKAVDKVAGEAANKASDKAVDKGGEA